MSKGRGVKQEKEEMRIKIEEKGKRNKDRVIETTRDLGKRE